MRWLRYQREILRTALNSSRARWGPNTAGKTLAFVISVGVLTLVLGWEQARGDLYRALLWTAGSLSAVVLLFIVDHWLTPYRIYSKQGDQIDALKADLARRTARRLIVESAYLQPGPIHRGTMESVASALFIKFKIRAAGRTLRNCRARITGMQFDAEGELFPFNIDHPITLVTGIDAEESVQLDPGVTTTFDVVVCDEKTNRLRFWPEDLRRPFLLGNCFDLPATYWLDVQVSADETPPESLRFGIRWTGRFSELQLLQPPE